MKISKRNLHHALIMAGLIIVFDLSLMADIAAAPIGTLGLELEDSQSAPSSSRGIGTLNLELEGETPGKAGGRGVGTLNLELEDSFEIPAGKKGVGSLNLELEGSENDFERASDPFGVATVEYGEFSKDYIDKTIPDNYESAAGGNNAKTTSNEIDQIIIMDPYAETDQYDARAFKTEKKTKKAVTASRSNREQVAHRARIVQKPAKSVEQIETVRELSEVERLGFLKHLLLKSGLSFKEKIASLKKFGSTIAENLAKKGVVSKEELAGLNPPVGFEYEICKENGLKQVEDVKNSPLDNDSIRKKTKTKKVAAKRPGKAVTSRPHKTLPQKSGKTGTLGLELEESLPAPMSNRHGSLGLELE